MSPVKTIAALTIGLALAGCTVQQRVFVERMADDAAPAATVPAVSYTVEPYCADSGVQRMRVDVSALDVGTFVAIEPGGAPPFDIHVGIDSPTADFEWHGSVYGIYIRNADGVVTHWSVEQFVPCPGDDVG